MEQIPNDEIHFYSQPQLNLGIYRSLLDTVRRTVDKDYRDLSKLEVSLVNEAIINMAFGRIPFVITYGAKSKGLDNSDTKADNNFVVLNCDKNGNLKDLSPLLPYVSIETRDLHSRLREHYK